MFGNNSRFYAVYVKKDSKNSFDDTIIIKQGFNFYAFIFSTFWALYNRIWWLFLALALIEGLVFYKTNLNPETVTITRLIMLTLQMWLGFEANDIKGKNLERKGYILLDVVSAQDETEANRRFFDKYMLSASA